MKDEKKWLNSGGECGRFYEWLLIKKVTRFQRWALQFTDTHTHIRHQCWQLIMELAMWRRRRRWLGYAKNKSALGYIMCLYFVYRPRPRHRTPMGGCCSLCTRCDNNIDAHCMASSHIQSTSHPQPLTDAELNRTEPSDCSQFNRIEVCFARIVTYVRLVAIVRDSVCFR